MKFSHEKVTSAVNARAKKLKLTTAAEVAEAMKIAVPTYRRTVRYQETPAISTLCHICVFTGKKPNYFFVD